MAPSALALTARYVPESRAAVPRRLDTRGQVLVIAFLAALVYALIQGSAAGWGSAPVLSRVPAPWHPATS